MANPKKTITLRSTKVDFHERYDALIKGSWVNDRLVHFSDSDQAAEDYSWLGPVPALEEWIGDRIVKGLLAVEYEIKNKKFQAAIKLMRDWFKRQKTANIMAKIGGLAKRAGQEHLQKLISAAIVAGESAACYDTQYFFDTDHVTPGAEYSTSQSNLISETLDELPTSNHGTANTAPSVEDMAYLIMQAIGTIQSFKDEFGEPTNQGSTDFLVMVGTIPLATAAHGAVSKMNLASGETNQLVSMKANDGSKLNIQVVYNPRMSSLTTKFDVYDVTPGSGQAFIVQEEEGPVVETLGEGSDYCFDHDAYKFGVKVKRNVGYGLWRKAVRYSLSQT